MRVGEVERIGVKIDRNYGEEEFGYFIDKEKARYFYAETQKAKDYHHDESLLANGNPMDGYD